MNTNLVEVRKFIKIENLNDWIVQEYPHYTEEQILEKLDNFDSDYDDQWTPVHDYRGWIIGYLEVK